MNAFCPYCQKVQMVTIDTPSRCTVCQKFWRGTGIAIEQPTKPYVLSENDRRMLRGLKIKPEV